MFFAWDEEAKRIFTAEAERIAACRERFSFSLHLPDPLPDDAADLIAATSSFVERYVFHPWGDDPQTGQCHEWRTRLDGLFEAFGRDRFSLEYTGAAAFARSSAFLPGLTICADTGRLLRDGIDPGNWISARAGSIGEIHLHGAQTPVSQEAGRDHLPLTGAEAWLPALLGQLAGTDCIVNLETFSLEATKASRDALKRWIS